MILHNREFYNTLGVGDNKGIFVKVYTKNLAEYFRWLVVVAGESNKDWGWFMEAVDEKNKNKLDCLIWFRNMEDCLAFKIRFCL